MNRRAFIAAAPAVALAGTAQAQGMATITIPSPDTPVMALFREWERVRDAYNGHPGDDDDEVATELLDRLYRIEDQISEARSETAADVGRKIVMVETYGDFKSDHFKALLAEARALVA